MRRRSRGFWANTLAGAFLTKAIAGRLGLNPDNAFLCGLLHAIGKPYVTHTVNIYQPECPVRRPCMVLDRVIQESYVEAGRQLELARELPDSVNESLTIHEDCAFEKANLAG